MFTRIEIIAVGNKFFFDCRKYIYSGLCNFVLAITRKRFIVLKKREEKNVNETDPLSNIIVVRALR